MRRHLLQVYKSRQTRRSTHHITISSLPFPPSTINPTSSPPHRNLSNQSFNMQFTTLLATAILATSTVLASPAFHADKRQQAVCLAGLYTTPLCCATDVLGVADLDCAARTSLSLFA